MTYRKRINDRIEFLEWKQKHKVMPLEEEQDVSNELTSLRKL